MRPEPSCSVAKLALPMTRLSIMRPATLAGAASSARASLSSSPYLACSSAALLSGLKSLGKATPSSRSRASLPRRSAIRWFSSVAGAEVGSVMSRYRIGGGFHRGTVKRQAWPARCCRAGAAPQRSGASGGGAGGAASYALFETGLDEGIQGAVQYFLRVGDFDVGAQVFDAALVQHVRADLVAPAHVGLGVFHFLLLGHAFAHFHFVEPRLEHLHGL